jgi:hypothetical protein
MYVYQAKWKKIKERIVNFINRFENLMKWVKFQAKSANYKVDYDCNPATLAWSYPLVQTTDIRLCNPNYFDVSSEEQWNTMIHEWTHLYFGSGDIAYNWEKKFKDLSTPQSLFNADSYSEFIKHICP